MPATERDYDLVEEYSDEQLLKMLQKNDWITGVLSLDLKELVWNTPDEDSMEAVLLDKLTGYGMDYFCDASWQIVGHDGHKVHVLITANGSPLMASGQLQEHTADGEDEDDDEDDEDEDDEEYDGDDDDEDDDEDGPRDVEDVIYDLQDSDNLIDAGIDFADVLGQDFELTLRDAKVSDPKRTRREHAERLLRSNWYDATDEQRDKVLAYT